MGWVFLFIAGKQTPNNQPRGFILFFEVSSSIPCYYMTDTSFLPPDHHSGLRGCDLCLLWFVHLHSLWAITFQKPGLGHPKKGWHKAEIHVAPPFSKYCLIYFPSSYQWKKEFIPIGAWVLYSPSGETTHQSASASASGMAPTFSGWRCVCGTGWAILSCKQKL